MLKPSLRRSQNMGQWAMISKKNHAREYFDIIKISIHVWCETCTGECPFVYSIHKTTCFCTYHAFSPNWFGNMTLALTYICITGTYICIGSIYKPIGKKVWQPYFNFAKQMWSYKHWASGQDTLSEVFGRRICTHADNAPLDDHLS